MSSPPVVLNSWKEIACYLGRGVRTVQRYERERQLPVRRVQGKSHSSVLALTKELDDWLRRTSLHTFESSAIEDVRNGHLLERHQEAISTLNRNLQALNERLLVAQRIGMRQRWFGPEDRGDRKGGGESS